MSGTLYGVPTRVRNDRGTLVGSTSLTGSVLGATRPRVSSWQLGVTCALSFVKHLAYLVLVYVVYRAVREVTIIIGHVELELSVSTLQVVATYTRAAVT